jgi:two-component system response regulator GlrR
MTLPSQGTPDGSAGRVLIVDDDEDTVELLRAGLEDEGLRVEVCATIDRLKDKLAQYSFDCILLDLCLGEESGVEAIPFIVREAPFTAIVVMTAFGSIEVAVEAMGKGATSFLTKSGDPGRVTAEIRSLLARRAGAAAGTGAGLARFGVVGHSPWVVRAADHVERLRDVDAPVLITGESGTGKQLFARAIHGLSARADKPFAALNCGAIPAAVLANELFGEGGPGALEDPAGGTVFLSNITDMPASLQTRLLQVLEQRQERPGPRLIAATSRDLEPAVARGRFREELFFRLSVLPLMLPPLRERAEDIPALVESFITKFNRRYNRQARLPSREVMARLSAYPWPGNVRELENAVERAVVMAQDGDLRLEHMLRAGREAAGTFPAAPTTLSYADAKETFERTFLLRILTAAKGSIAEAARLSGRYRSDIYRLMQRYDITPDAFKE